VEDLLNELLQVVEAHGGWGALLLLLSSLIEYVFPPFPGDLITLFGTYLVVKGVWSFPFALCLVMVGSLVGATIDYGIGHWLGHRLERLPSEQEPKRRWTPLTREKYQLLSERFRRYGAVYISINRFLPGIRAFFFVAAGAARMPLWKVLVYATLSALLWNTLILGAGIMAGKNWDRLRGMFESYSMIVWILMGSVMVGGLVFWFVRRRRRSRQGGEGRPA